MLAEANGWTSYAGTHPGTRWGRFPGVALITHNGQDTTVTVLHEIGGVETLNVHATINPPRIVLFSQRNHSQVPLPTTTVEYSSNISDQRILIIKGITVTVYQRYRRGGSAKDAGSTKTEVSLNPGRKITHHFLRAEEGVAKSHTFLSNYKRFPEYIWSSTYHLFTYLFHPKPFVLQKKVSSTSIIFRVNLFHQLVCF